MWIFLKQWLWVWPSALTKYTINLFYSLLSKKGLPPRFQLFWQITCRNQLQKRMRFILGLRSGPLDLLTQYTMVIRSKGAGGGLTSWCCISFPFQKHTEWLELAPSKDFPTYWQWHSLTAKPLTWTFRGHPRPKLWQLHSLTVVFPWMGMHHCRFDLIK